MAKVEVAALCGEDHPELGGLATAEVEGGGALAVSPGRYPKAAPHLDPNEDGVLVAAGPAGWVLAAADGHHGIDAARGALRAVARGAGSLLAHDPKPTEVRELCRAAADEANAAAARAEGRRRDSDTALALTVVAGSRALVANHGDTTVVRLRGPRGKVLTGPQPFLRVAAEPPGPRRVRLRAGDRLVLASDGVPDFLGQDWPERMAALTEQATTPAHAARALLTAAMDGAAGDHLAAALLDQRGREG